MKKKFPGHLAIVAFLVFYAQISSVAQLKIPALDFMPASPTAASFARYGEIPVSYSSGVPEIDIPIYTVKVGNVEVPISISYHASGIKVRDVASEVGLGFTLNTGGVITATIIGIGDWYNYKPTGRFLESEDIPEAINDAALAGTTFDLAWDYWHMLFQNPGLWDYYSDRYSYRLPTGESGVFRKD